MSILEMYLVRAAQCHREAAQATLENVRERALRSALAWEGMADQVRITEVYQQANEAARREEAANLSGVSAERR